MVVLITTFINLSKDVAWSFGYSELEELASGDHSWVFKAKGPGAKVAIKVLTKSPRDHWNKIDYTKHLEIASRLKCPSFIRLRRWVS